MSQYAGGYPSSDLSRGMTLRNASENRRLVGHLQHLDLQLHQNLVNMQAEIMHLKLSRNGMQHSRIRRPNTTMGKNLTDPRHVQERQLRAAVRISPLAVQGSKREISKPFLPQISTKQTALVGKRAEGVETRPNSSRHPGSPRRFRELSTDGANPLSTNTTSNLYRPRSTPDLCISPAKSESRPATSKPMSDSVADGGSTRSLDKTTSRSRSSEVISQPSLELSDRVTDFLKRPNTSSGERIKEGENEQKQSEKCVVPTINVEDQEQSNEEIEENPDESTQAVDEGDKGYLLDAELFRNSLLLRASRDDDFSRSMPDLSSLGFMDFNEVIDQRLRKVKEEIPSEEEMRKIRYLRFRDEPAPLPTLSVFEKENIQELDKINE